MPTSCFWCNKELSKGTKDHLFSKYLRKTNDNNKTIVPSCKKCNGQRGHISSVYELIHRLKTNTYDNWEIRSKPKKKRIRRIVEKAKFLAEEFKRRIL